MEQIMDDIDTAPLIQEIERLKALQLSIGSKLTPSSGPKVIGVFIAFGIGLFGVLATLREGLRWEWAIAIGIGATAYHLARESEKRAVAFREMLARTSAELEAAEQRLNSATAKERLMKMLDGSSLR
jgi:hypothetical protein